MKRGKVSGLAQPECRENATPFSLFKPAILSRVRWSDTPVTGILLM